MKTVTFDEDKYALVPIEPTADMLTAAWNVEQSGRCPDEEREVWKAMLAASPSAPIAEGDEL